jgi:DNA invertase Pin-like site-specific DNA recombinase
VISGVPAQPVVILLPEYNGSYQMQGHILTTRTFCMADPNRGLYVAYYRVSTQRQGASGLGLEAQQRAVRDHLDDGRWTLLRELVEIESGKRADRPKLEEALTLCRVHGAKLIIAKLDRLARNVAFVSNLMKSDVEFEAVDFPQANRLTIHILAAVAEHEAEAISNRTKAALAAAKARGVKLGGFRGRAGSPASCAVARRARSAKVAARAADLAPVIAEIRSAGAASLRAVAAALNARRIAAPRGGMWAPNHAPPRLRLRARQQGARHQGDPGMARPSVDHEHRGLYGLGAEPV